MMKKMKILCLQYDDRGDIYPELSAINRNLGFEYLFLTESEFNVPPYWVKVFLVDKYLPDYDFILWLDSDAVIINRSLLPKFEKDFIYAPDPPQWNCVPYGTFNAGAFIIKNSPIGLSILQDWKKGYNSEKWENNGGWKCQGEWAGIDYEQGYFCEHLLKKYSEHIQMIPQNIMQALNHEDIIPETFGIHFYAQTKEKDIRAYVEYLSKPISKMKILCLQSDNRGDIYPELTALNKESGFDHLFITESFDIPPWWIKIFLVKKYLPSTEAVLWLDSDAGIINPRALPESKKTMIYAPDPPNWLSPFNAGVFLLRNTPLGNKIIEDWANGYDSSKWQLVEGQWKYEGDWLGPSLEQGYFNHHLYEKYKEEIEIVSPEVFQVSHYSDITPRTFNLHFLGGHKEHYNQTMKEFQNKRYRTQLFNTKLLHYNADVTNLKWREENSFELSGPISEGARIYLRMIHVKFLASQMDTIDAHFILITGDEDLEASSRSFPSREEFLQFVNSEKLIHWYAQNLNEVHPKITPIPIGLDYHTLTEKDFFWGPMKTPLEQEEELLSVYNSSKPFWERKIHSYSNWHLTPWDVRKEALREIPSEITSYQSERMPRIETWKEQAEYAFVISPHGNGLDCHRTWEALALGCIVIDKTSSLDPLYDDLPVLIVKAWQDLSFDLLRSTVEAFKDRTFKMEKLRSKYFWDLIMK